jgi:hypothetical protein
MTTSSLALELAPVRVNLIAAGFVDTPLSASLLGADLDKRRDQLRSTLPIGRVVGPADVAALAVHIMTNTALTGATFDYRRRSAARREVSLCVITPRPVPRARAQVLARYSRPALSQELKLPLGHITVPPPLPEEKASPLAVGVAADGTAQAAVIAPIRLAGTSKNSTSPVSSAYSAPTTTSLPSAIRRSRTGLPWRRWSAAWSTFARVAS